MIMSSFLLKMTWSLPALETSGAFELPYVGPGIIAKHADTAERIARIQVSRNAHVERHAIWSAQGLLPPSKLRFRSLREQRRGSGPHLRRELHHTRAVPPFALMLNARNRE